MSNNNVKFPIITTSLVGIAGALGIIFMWDNQNNKKINNNKSFKIDNCISLAFNQPNNPPKLIFSPNSHININPNVNINAPKDFSNEKDKKIQDFLSTPLIVEYIPYMYINGSLKEDAKECQTYNSDSGDYEMKPGHKELGKRKLKVYDVKIDLLNSNLKNKVEKIYKKDKNERTPKDEQLLNKEICIGDVAQGALTLKMQNQYINVLQGVPNQVSDIE